MTSPPQPPDDDPFVEALDQIKGKPARRGSAWRAFFEQFLAQALARPSRDGSDAPD